jgi:anti-anti-sigma factor
MCIRPDRDAPALVLEGEIDLSNSDVIGAVLHALEPPPGGVIVDLAGVDFMDSTAVQELIRARHRLVSEGSAIAVTNPRSHIRRLFELLGLDEVFLIPAPAHQPRRSTSHTSTT